MNSNKNVQITESVFNYLADNSLAKENAGLISKDAINELRCERDVANMSVRCATVNNIIVNKSRIIKKYRAQLASDKLTDEKRHIISERLNKAMTQLERAKATLLSANVKMRERYGVELLDNADLVVCEQEPAPAHTKQTEQISEDDVNRANEIIEKYEKMNNTHLLNDLCSCDELVRAVRRDSIDNKDRADVNDLLKQYPVKTKADRAVVFEGKKYNLRGLESRVFRYLNSEELKSFAQVTATKKGKDVEKFMLGFTNCINELSFYLTRKKLFMTLFEAKYKDEAQDDAQDVDSNVNENNAIEVVDNVNCNQQAA